MARRGPFGVFACHGIFTGKEAGGKKVSYNRVIAAHALREGKERERKKLKKLWVVPAAPWRWSRATSRSPTS